MTLPRTAQLTSHLLLLIQLRHIPTVGYTIPILSFLDGVRFIKNAKRLLQEGYDKVCHLYVLNASFFAFGADDSSLVQGWDLQGPYARSVACDYHRSTIHR